jgi:hypothetical protein
LRNIKSKCDKFLIDGSILLDSNVSQWDKFACWHFKLKPNMLKIWNLFNFIPSDDRTWPTGRTTHHLSLTNGNIPGMPQIFSNSFHVQAIISQILDPSLMLIHFGPSTHWKLKLLVQPLWLLSNEYRPEDMFLFEGSDQAWHIVNIPQIDTNISAISGVTSRQKVDGTHLDGGEDGVFHRCGFPLQTSENDSSLKHLVEDRMLTSLLHQLAIVFYCETPGRMGIEEGATGVFTHSHFVVIEAINRVLTRLGCRYSIPWIAFHKSMKEFGNPSSGEESTSSLCRQIEVPHDKMVLSFGLTAHTAMRASRLMEGGEVRTIVNCKVKAAKDIRESEQSQSRLVSRIPRDSLLRRLVTDAMGAASELMDPRCGLLLIQ